MTLTKLLINTARLLERAAEKIYFLSLSSEEKKVHKEIQDSIRKFGKAYRETMEALVIKAFEES